MENPEVGQGNSMMKGQSSTNYTRITEHSHAAEWILCYTLSYMKKNQLEMDHSPKYDPGSLKILKENRIKMFLALGYVILIR